MGETVATPEQATACDRGDSAVRGTYEIPTLRRDRTPGRSSRVGNKLKKHKRRQHEEWLSKLPYKKYLKTGHWLNLRDRIVERDHVCCLCGSDEGLQVHHKTYERRGRELLKDLCLLCDDCHGIRHHGGVRVLVNQLDILHLRNGPSKARRMVHKVLS